jgi:signal peptidase I
MKNWLRSNRGFLLFLVLFGLVRTACADWNPIPSGSMRPNLLEGDVVLVNRLAYAIKLPLTDVVLVRTGEPRRGDIVVFSSPRDGTRLIKRLVALPGDTIAMFGKQLIINGTPVAYAATGLEVEQAGDTVQIMNEALPGHPHSLQWMMDRANAPDFGPITVPPDHYLMLGDNRDNSADSRYFGFVPRERLNGRAERILASAAILEDWRPRFDRFLMPLK